MATIILSSWDLAPRIVVLAGCKGHEGLVGHSCEFPLEPDVVVVADVLLEVVAGDNKIGSNRSPIRSSMVALQANSCE
jgi:hypothetical protein